MRRFIYSTKKINATVDVDSIPDLYVVKIWHEVEANAEDCYGPEAAEEIITVFANSPQQALEYAKNEWSGPIDRIEIVDVNPEDYDYDSTSIFNSTKVTAASSDREASKRNKMYRPSLYPDVDPERIEDLLAINWNDVYARDCEYILKDTVNFPDLSIVKSVRYPSDEEQAAIEESMYDGGYQVTYTDGTTAFFAWHDGQDGMDEITIPETVEGSGAIMSSRKSYADRKTVEDNKREQLYKPSLYPQYTEDRINNLLAINWNDVAARDSADFLNDVDDFPYLEDIESIRYATDEEMEDLRAQKYDGAYIVTYKDGDSTPVAWKNNSDELFPFPIEQPALEDDITGSTDTDEEISFRDWLDSEYYPGFDPSGLSDEEYFELEDQYRADVPRKQREFNYR